MVLILLSGSGKSLWWDPLCFLVLSRYVVSATFLPFKIKSRRWNWDLPSLIASCGNDKTKMSYRWCSSLSVALGSILIFCKHAKNHKIQIIWNLNCQPQYFDKLYSISLFWVGYNNEYVCSIDNTGKSTPNFFICDTSKQIIGGKSHPLLVCCVKISFLTSCTTSLNKYIIHYSSLTNPKSIFVPQFCWVIYCKLIYTRYKDY